MKGKNVGKKPFDIFFSIVVIAVLFSVVVNDLKNRINFIKTGVEPLSYPQPYGSIIRIDTPVITLGMVVPKTQENPVGSDYVQVYLSAKALSQGKSAYRLEESHQMDPFNRLPNYPPIVNWAYIPLSRVFFPTGLLIHDFVTLGLFVLVSMLILLQTGYLRDSWKILILYLLLYFYTPLGFSHFEKGQFDFYSAGALLLPSVIFMNNSGLPYFFTTGLFAAFKWSSFPFVGAFSAFGFIASDGRKRWPFLIPIILIALSILLFWQQFLDYLPSLRYFEVNVDSASGLSFMHYMPKSVAKIFQIVNLGIFSGCFLYFSRKINRQQMLEIACGPFALAMAAEGMCFGAISNEYRVVSLLGLIVPFFLWAEKAAVPQKIKILVAGSLAIFMVQVFRNFQYLIKPDDAQQTLVFLIASLFWMGISFYLVYINRNGPSETFVQNS